MKDFTNPSAWLKNLARAKDLRRNPFDAEPLGPAPVFLYSETTSPLPAAEMEGSWSSYPIPQHLAAHLRFGLLPLDFSIWLCREEWDETPKKPKTAEEIWACAKAAGIKYAKDIPAMEKVVKALDQAITAQDADESWTLIEKACRTFNKRWASTPTWNLVHRPLRDAKSLVRDLVKRDSSEMVDEDDVRALTSLDFSDPKAAKRLRSILKEAIVF